MGGVFLAEADQERCTVNPPVFTPVTLVGVSVTVKSKIYSNLILRNLVIVQLYSTWNVDRCCCSIINNIPTYSEHWDNAAVVPSLSCSQCHSDICHWCYHAWWCIKSWSHLTWEESNIHRSAAYLAIDIGGWSYLNIKRQDDFWRISVSWLGWWNEGQLCNNRIRNSCMLEWM